MPALPGKGLVAPIILGFIGCAVFASSSGDGTVKTSGDDTAKNPRFVLGKGSNGTELYVKVENSVHEQFSKSKDNQGQEVTLWLGETKLTKDHKLWPWGTGNKYSLVEGVRTGQYRLQDGVTATGGQVEGKLKSGGYEYIGLNRNRESRGRGNNGSSFGGNQCKYLWNGRNGGEKGELQVRCIGSDRDWKGNGDRPDHEYITLKLTKNDYVLIN